MTARIQLYCNPVTSEVASEHATLHDAIAVATPSAAGALLICEGVILATAVARGWLFEQSGIERLHNEFGAAAKAKNLELKELIAVCIRALEQMDLTLDGHELVKALRKAIGKED